MYCDHAVKHETIFNCNKTVGVDPPKNYKHLALNGESVKFAEHVKYLGVLLHASLKDNMTFRSE